MKDLLPIAITPNNLDSLVVVFVVDISRPKSSVRLLAKWAREVQSKIKDAKKSDSSESKSEQNDKWCGVKKVIVGSFLDKCNDFTKEQMLSVINTFRYFANHYESDLVFTNLNKQTIDNYIGIMNKNLFNDNRIKANEKEMIVIPKGCKEYENFGIEAVVYFNNIRNKIVKNGLVI